MHFLYEKFHLDCSRIDEVSSLLYLDNGMDAGSGDLNIFSLSPDVCRRACRLAAYDLSYRS